ncbi:hypothetical protein DFH09DRAFT_1287429 [Mycena vulgaris]|nr:hypothetical protein DFH09DRAFT_1287429 [Mycena vulgaris]
MAPPATATQTRLNNLTVYLTVATSALGELERAGTPFLTAISSTVAALLNSVQNVKRKAAECAQFLDDIHTILYGIIALHLKSDGGGALSPATLDHIGKFTQTLQKIWVFMDSQQEGNKIKQFLRQSETSILLKDCNLGLQQALEVFQVLAVWQYIQTGANILADIGDMQRNAEERHNELLELMTTVSDESSSDRLSTLNGSLIDSQSSTNSLSMLPGQPKIFYGREMELEHIVKTLSADSARIAILGAGGMGKTSLAKAALHHPDITAKYTQQFFVTADSVSTGADLAGLVGSHLGLKPSKKITKMIVDYFSNSPACLLILDNLETTWEPTESRRDVEEFLACLTGVPHLALIVTMRGAERPAKVKWTHPFLPPLGPLSDEAALETFTDIAPGSHDTVDIEKMLALTDNLPLAVNLVAHLVDYEGCPTVLTRWETEKTLIISDGYDKRSNLDVSISLSLSSPRMLAFPGAKDLLSILAILPDGLSDSDLIQSALPITDILACKTTLLQTSLGYIGYDGHLKALGIIREYMNQVHPPPSTLVNPLLQHFHLLLEFCTSHVGLLPSAKVVMGLASNLGNIQSVLLSGLQSDDTQLKDVIECTLQVNAFRRFTGRGRSDLVAYVPDALTKVQDPRLWTNFITQVFNSWSSDMSFLTGKSQNLIVQAQENFAKLSDPEAEAGFYNGAGYFYLEHDQDPARARKFFETAISLTKSNSKSRQQSYALVQLSWIERNACNYSAALVHAREAKRLAQISGNLSQGARLLRVEAVFSYDLGRYNHGMYLCHKGRELLQVCGLSGSVVDLSLLTTMAAIHYSKTEYAEARSIYASIIRDVDPAQYSYALGLHGIADIDVLIGAKDIQVQKNLDTAYQIFSAVGNTYMMTTCDVVRAELYLRQEEFSDAKILLQTCHDRSRGKAADTQDLCLYRLADVTCWGPSETHWTPSWAIVFLAHSLKLHKNLQIHQALRCLGEIFLESQDRDTAHSLFALAFEGFAGMEVHRSKGDCMLRLGDIASHNGDLPKAMELYKGALPLFERSLQAKSISQINARLAAMERRTRQEEDKIRER